MKHNKRLPKRLPRDADGLPEIRRYLLDDGSTCLECSDGTWVGQTIGSTKSRPAGIVMKLF